MITMEHIVLAVVNKIIQNIRCFIIADWCQIGPGNSLRWSRLAKRNQLLKWSALEYVKLQNEPAIERVQALADISRSALYAFAVYKAVSYIRVCCHSNETRAPIVNPPISAQLEGTIYHSSKSHPGPYNNVGMRWGRDRHTAVANTHFASAVPHAKCNKKSVNVFVQQRRVFQEWRYALRLTTVTSPMLPWWTVRRPMMTSPSVRTRCTHRLLSRSSYRALTYHCRKTPMHTVCVLYRELIHWVVSHTTGGGRPWS